MKFYVTTSIAYANGNPHLGYAMELTQADVLARYHRTLLLDNTRFLTGMDEHGIKIFQTAQKEGLSPQAFVDAKSAQFAELAKALRLSNDDFIRTTDQQRHWPGVIRLWQAIQDNDDIYLKKYKGLYSVRAERFVTQKELDEDQGAEHSQVVEVEEENYFFRLSKYEAELKRLIESDTVRIVPQSKKNEILNFINQGMDDISFSRSAEKLPWGIPVPGDRSQVMYVWCDALANYISALGYGSDNTELFDTFWPADVHLVGKDIIRFHAIYWPAMLLSARLPLPKQIFVHGFINVDGQKMSKSLGNVIDPFDIIQQHGTDPFRYYLLREIPSTSDGDFSQSRFIDRYNDDLANGLGNLVARVAKMCEKSELEFSAKPDSPQNHAEYARAMNDFELHRGLEYIWQLISQADQQIDQAKPWTLTGDDLASELHSLTNQVTTIAALLQPYLPDTSAKILAQFSVAKIKSSAPLFPRYT